MSKYQNVCGFVLMCHRCRQVNEMDEFNLFENSDVPVIKELLEYLKSHVDNSEENIERCKPFEVLKDEYSDLQKKYCDSFHELYDGIEERTVRRDYGKGGIMHRGYYSPSTQDLYVGNCKRGKLLKRAPKGNNYDYEYMFDESGKMICCKEYWLKNSGEFIVYDIELFVYSEDRVISLTYSMSPLSKNRLKFITDCRYENGKIRRYVEVQCSNYLDKYICDFIEIEDLEYENELLKIVYTYSYTPSIKILNKHKYTFERDEEGYFSTYTVEDLSNEYRASLGSCTYKVKAKRK